LAAPAHHKEGLALILAPGDILFYPIKRARAEKQHPLSFHATGKVVAVSCFLATPVQIDCEREL
jgi:hypothetical protein